MIVDSSALLAILLREAEAAKFSDAIARAGDPKMSAASYIEVALKVDRFSDTPYDELDRTLTALGITLVPVTVAHARIAREAFNRFGRAPAKLNFGDCLVYALAQTSALPLLFKGNAFTHTDIIPAMPVGV